ncbi:unnamed protein product [Parnassius apollo]|uniref:(apollo) hypothetical protein n=1 Tax=Parnassius apollo TaxID=110799 RepID=A0A8S3XZB1_PARAO|nr:unnamed protein product [Parnassius apollo]
MYTDIPSFTKCCFCAPLRYGLLVWAYFKLVTSIIIFASVLIWLLNFTKSVVLIADAIHFLALFVATISIHLFDIIFNLVLIIGIHKKHVTLLRLYYRYGVAHAFVITATALICIVYAIASTSAPFDEPNLWHKIVVFASAICASMLVHTYLLILVRSEVLKLKANSQFKFSNQAADPTCVMQDSNDVTENKDIDEALLKHT